MCRSIPTAGPGTGPRPRPGLTRTSPQSSNCRRAGRRPAGAWLRRPRSRSAAGCAYRQLPGQRGFRGRREPRGFLVPHMLPGDRAVPAQRVGEPVQRVARDPVHPPHPRRLQRRHHHISHRGRHLLLLLACPSCLGQPLPGLALRTSEAAAVMVDFGRHFAPVHSSVSLVRWSNPNGITVRPRSGPPRRWKTLACALVCHRPEAPRCSAAWRAPHIRALTRAWPGRYGQAPGRTVDAE